MPGGPEPVGEGEAGETTPHVSFRPKPHAYHHTEELQKRTSKNHNSFVNNPNVLLL